MNLIKLMAGAALATALAGGANAATVDFNAHAPDYNNPIFDSGFEFNVTASGWGVFKASDGACCTVNDNGTRALFADGDRNGSVATVVMTKSGGGTFDVSSLDAAVYFTGASADTLVLTGTKFGGGTVSTVLNTSTAWTHYVLPGSFNNLTSLEFQDGTSGGFLSAPGMGIDNINLTAGVPEPSTWAMVILGVGAIGFAARRRIPKGAAA